MKDVLEINEFFVEGKDQERSHVLLHITEPGTPEEEKKGYFFALAEINNGNLEQIEHLQQMIDDLESGYYETDNNEENAFETTLEFINRRGHHILQYKDSVISCIVGVLRGHELSFAYHGSPQANLFYQGKQDLETLDILADGEELNANHLFSSMMQGEINEGDLFYIATPHVMDYFNTDRVKKIITNRNSRQSAEHVQKVLSDINRDLSFGGILFQFPNKNQMPTTGRQPKKMSVGSEESLNKMLTQAKSTEEILSPPILKNIKKNSSSLLDNLRQKHNEKQLNKVQNKRKKNLETKRKGNIETNYRPRTDKPETILNTVLISIGRALVTTILGLFKLIKTIFFFTYKSLVALFLIISNRGGQRSEVIREYKNRVKEKKQDFGHMPMTSRILLIATIIFALIFIVSLLIFKTKENIQADRQAYNNQVQAIIDKKNAADASLIYDDEERALALLHEAQTLVETLPDNKKDEKLELNTEIDSVLIKLRKIIEVTPTILVDLSGVNESAMTEKIALLDNTLFVFGPDDINLYKLNASTKELQVTPHNTIPRLILADTPKENDKIIFASGDQSLAEYNKEINNLTKLDVNFEQDTTKITDLFIYNGRVYILDPINNQIYKHNLTQTGYDKGTPWLKDNSDISDGVSLAIDGDLFVLKQNGEIFKFDAGNKTNFNITGLDPALENPTEIWTYNDIDNLYILEPTNKRVVILDKTGKLLNQYTYSAWQNPTSMIIDEPGKTIYVLDSNKIYSFKY